VPAPDLGEGSPPSLIRLADGRLCLTYGRRAPPYSIRARLSSNGGRTWSDSRVVTVYYFWDKRTGPERYIAATIWDPAKVSSRPVGK
jgi:hypothetical protein